MFIVVGAGLFTHSLYSHWNIEGIADPNSINYDKIIAGKKAETMKKPTRLFGAGIGILFCFNTSMTGYQEIMTDPSYAKQIINFTFPHIGNVGVNNEDIDTVNMAAASGTRGVVLHADITQPSNFPLV